MVALLILFITLIGSVASHSWLTCPPSYMNTNVGRGGEQTNACENSGVNAHVTNVEAGDRLKVGWTSNNHAGGYVRLSLIPFTENPRESDLKGNVLKFVCYGHDTRPHKTVFGDCKHPCDARQGCEYQSNQYDINRYDTTITIPTNLNGVYVLQAAMLVGNTAKPYNSCAKLRIVGGNQNFNCRSSESILKYACLKSGGPALDGSIIETNTRRGDFCYRLNGEVGSVDEYLRDVPINIECDPRLSCANSVDSNCANVPGMQAILTPNFHPVSPNCRVYTRLPDPEPSCYDGVRNRDEEKVDCGGRFCEECPFVKFEGNYYEAIKANIQVYSGQHANIAIEIHITKDIGQWQCWEVNLQYQIALSLDHPPWGDGILVGQHPDCKILTFQRKFGYNDDGVKMPAGVITKGRRIKLNIQVTNKELAEATGKTQDELDQLKWTVEKLQFITALFEVYDDDKKCLSKESTNYCRT